MKKKKKDKLEVILEYENTSNAEERLLKAFAILLEEEAREKGKPKERKELTCVGNHL